MVSVAANKASRMDQYKNPSLLRLAIYLVLATTLFFFGLVLLRLADLDPSRGALHYLVPSLLFFITPALFCTMRIAGCFADLRPITRRETSVVDFATELRSRISSGVACFRSDLLDSH